MTKESLTEDQRLKTKAKNQRPKTHDQKPNTNDQIETEIERQRDIVSEICSEFYISRYSSLMISSL